MKYLILIILFLFSFNFALAEELTSSKHLKQNLESIPDKVQSGFSKIMESFQNRFQEEKEEFKEDIKEEIKQEAKEQSEKKIRWAEETIKSWLAPLKIRFEQGSQVLKGWMNKGIDWVKSL